MGKYKAKASQADIGIFTHIHAYSDIFRHDQPYSGIIQAFSEPCVTLAYLKPWYIQNPGMLRMRSKFRTLVYSEPWHIQQHPGIFRALVYAEPWHIQNPRHIQNYVKYLRCSVLRK